MIECVTGFLFNTARNRVVLIQKRRPDWQAGKYNGVGGKTEPNETVAASMNREFHEETGVIITSWERFLSISHLTHGSYVHFFRAFNDVAMSLVESKTDEKVEIQEVQNLKLTIPNLRWIIPLALDLEYQPVVTMVLR
jgi:8-oxo-dGTP diphosphatase